MTNLCGKEKEHQGRKKRAVTWRDPKQQQQQQVQAYVRKNTNKRMTKEKTQTETTQVD